MSPNILVIGLILMVSAIACGNSPEVRATPTPTTSSGSPGIIATATAYARSLKATPKPAPTPTPTQAPREMVVGNTGGMGVYVRRTPSMEDKIKAWPDGTTMRVTGKETEGEGKKWLPVEDPDGNQGYVPSEYLVPSTPE
ncbi:MAG: SH3 domain-containing protein [Chloroflexi bacterium]|nr:SH3 domain-containing protein [Chloroflexota bacterium]